MNVITPTLRQLPDGRWYTRWSEKRFYFGRDPAEAARRFADSLEQWTAWRDEKQLAFQIKPRDRVTLAELAEQFLEVKLLEGGPDRKRYYKKHLKAFLTGWGLHDATAITVRNLNTIRNDQLRAGYAPKTVNHDITAMKGLMNWAMDLEHIPPVNLRGCKKLPLGAPPDKSMPVENAWAFIDGAPDHIRPWLALNYFAVLRPTEVVDIVNGNGSWSESEPGLYRLDRSKTEHRTRQPRHVVFSETAKAWLKECRPRWSRLDSYSQAVRDACGPGGPHPLRHSAATHLQLMGVDRASIDLILGHLPGRVSLTYARIEWQPLREKVALLAHAPIGGL